jgi:GxxExxY protein
MIYELRVRNLTVSSELKVPVRYKELVLDGFYRLDLLVNDAVVVELKAVEAVHPVHRAQVLSYLRLMEKQLGLLINFHVDRLVLGVDRIVNSSVGRTPRRANRPKSPPHPNHSPRNPRSKIFLRASAALRHVITNKKG